MPTDRIDFVDEDNARRVLLRILEHVADTRGADTDKHFNEIGTGDREEGHLGLASNGLRQQGLAGTRIADHQHTLGNTPTELLKFRRIAQEVNQLLDLLLSLVTASNIDKGHRILCLIHHPRTRLAEREGTSLASSLHLAHEEHPDTDQEQHGEPTDEDIHQERGLFFRPRLDLDAIFQQVRDQPKIGRRVGSDPFTLARRCLQGSPLHHHLGDSPLLDLLNELGVFDRSVRYLTAIELIENGHQHQADHQPDRKIFEHVVQACSPLSNVERKKRHSKQNFQRKTRPSKYNSGLRSREASGFLT